MAKYLFIAVDGVIGLGPYSGAGFSDNGYNLFIGWDDSYSLNSAPPLVGYADEIRITKNVCRYPNGADFSPPSAPFGESGVDPEWDNVVLLLHCEGADGSTTVTDASGSSHSVTAVGNAHIETDQYKAGSASVQMDGSGDWLTVPSSTDFAFGTGEWTGELFIRASDTTARRIFGRRYGYTSVGGNWTIYFTTDGTAGIVSSDGGGSYPHVTNTGFAHSPKVLQENTWHHIAFGICEYGVGASPMVFGGGLTVA